VGQQRSKQVGAVRLGLQLCLERSAGLKPVAQQHKVAWRAASGDEAAQCAAEIGHGLQ
jgi:hypothetical protein